MFNLPVFVGLDYHQNVIQVCVMEQFRKILKVQSMTTNTLHFEPNMEFFRTVPNRDSPIEIVCNTRKGSAIREYPTLLNREWN